MGGQDHRILAWALQSKAVLVILVAVTVFSLIRLSNEIIRRTRITREVREVQEEIVRLRSERDRLSSLAQYLSTDAYLEAEARRKLHLSRPGETVVVITDEPTAAAPAAGVYNPRAWFDYFFSNVSS